MFALQNKLLMKVRSFKMGKIKYKIIYTHTNQTYSIYLFQDGARNPMIYCNPI